MSETNAIPNVEQLPTPPKRSDSPEVFNNRADAFLGRLPFFGEELNEVSLFINNKSVQTGKDAAQTSADRTQTGNDVTQTSADRTQTGNDVTQTSADRTQTGKDAAQTSADRIQTGEDRNATAQDRQLAEQAKNDAQAIAVGDVAITDLQPGPITSEGDFVTAGPDGGLVKRSLRDGSQRASLSAYDLKAVETSSLIDLSNAQVYRIDATQGPVDLEVSALADPSQSITVILSVTGNNIINLSEPIAWSENKVPEMGDSWTLIMLFRDGARWMGGRSFYA